LEKKNRHLGSVNLAEFAQTLFEEAADALFLFDPDTETILDVNPMAQKLCGFPISEILRYPINYLLRSQTQGGLQNLRRAFRETGLFHSREGFQLRQQRHGSWLPVNLSVTRLHVRPRTLGLITARDVSERREAEVALKLKDAELQRVLRSVSDFLWSVQYDSQGKCVSSYYSPAVEALTGRTPTSYSAGPASWLQIIHSVDRAAVDDAFADARNGYLGDFEYEYRVVRPTGEVRWVRDRWHVSRPQHDSGIRIDGVGSDVTTRKAAEDSLRESESRYRSLIEDMSQEVFLKDGQLRYITVNQQFCRTVGHEASAIQGLTDFDLFPQEFAEKLRESDRQVLSTGERIEQELTLPAKAGDRILHVFKIPVLDPDNKIVGVQGKFWDVTAQRSLEAQLRQSQKMEAVGQLAGGLAHDFNNLLTAILGNLSLVLNDPALDESNRRFLEPAETAACRAAELTGQLLSFSRRNVLHTRPTDLNVVVADATSIVRRTTNLQIRLENRLTTELWLVSADPGQMNQVLINLCLNARDAMPDGGELTIETANVALPRPNGMQSLESRAGEFVRLSVVDTGVGIPQDVLTHIFEPFFTTKEPGKGTGLGLSMVLAIIHQHDGWIECHSTVGAGTRFDVFIPHDAKARIDAIPSSPKRDAVAGGTETILLVDDEAMIRNLARQILVNRGYRVLLAEDGVDALEVYRRQADTIDLIIMDVNMPRLSGIACCTRLREINSDVPVLISSGYANELIARHDDIRISGIVGKPYRVDDLLRAVRNTLDQSH
jgi:two-component system cell cycle sensor histidine kinase/response regulator CckA